MRSHPILFTGLFTGLLVAQALAQQPATVPSLAPSSLDQKTSAQAAKVETTVRIPGTLRPLFTPEKVPGPAGVDAPDMLAPPASLLFDTVDGQLWTVGQTYKASFGSEGATFLPFFQDAERNHPIAFAVHTASVGGMALPVHTAIPERNETIVAYDHGGLRAVYELQLRGFEQKFYFDALPTRGDLQLEVTLATDLHAERDGDGFVFTDPRGQVTYSAAVAVDADGNRLPIHTTLDAGMLRFHVPAVFVASARLPLCIDPLVSSIQTVYTNSAGHPVSRSDIAFEPSYGEYCTVFERQWSATDRDVFARRYNYDMTPSTLQILDISFVDWSRPRVAAHNVANRFLMVAKVSNGNVSPYWISGRLIDANTGILSAPFDIERAGWSGSYPGDKINPDVGGDMDYVGPSYFAVVWERVATPSDHDVHMKLVDGNGNLVTASPILIENSGFNETYPRISKTNGIPPYNTKCWGVVWQHTYLPTDEDIYGALVRWDGTITVPSQGIDTGPANALRPTISSPTDPSTGYRNYMIAYEGVAGSNRDILGSIIEEHGFTQGFWNLSSNVNPTWPHYAPTVDCDGARFAIGWTQIYGGSGSDYDTVLTTFGWNAALGVVLHDVAYPGFTTDTEFDMSITATHAEGSGAGRYGVTWTRIDVNNDFHIEALTYDGMLASGGLSTRPTACGTDANYQVFGRPVLGGWVHLSQALNTGFRGYLLGFPTSVPIGPCAGCTVGVTGGNSYFGSDLQIAIPANPAYLGLPLAAQGFSFVAGPCLSTVSVSDTLDLVLR